MLEWNLSKSTLILLDFEEFKNLNIFRVCTRRATIHFRYTKYIIMRQRATSLCPCWVPLVDVRLFCSGRFSRRQRARLVFTWHWTDPLTHRVGCQLIWPPWGSLRRRVVRAVAVGSPHGLFCGSPSWQWAGTSIMGFPAPTSTIRHGRDTGTGFAWRSGSCRGCLVHIFLVGSTTSP